MGPVNIDHFVSVTHVLFIRSCELLKYEYGDEYEETKSEPWTTSTKSDKMLMKGAREEIIIRSSKDGIARYVA